MKEAIIKILEQNLSFDETAIELEKLMDIRMSELSRRKSWIGLKEQLVFSFYPVRKYWVFYLSTSCS